MGDPPARWAATDILISDVGLHKLWIGRMFPAHEPNTVLIANGLAGHGLRASRRASRPSSSTPTARVVTVNGDGGFLMNCQELETAMRLKTPIVNVIWENRAVRLDRVEAGQASSAATSASTSPTPTSSSSPRPSACRPGAASPSTTSPATSTTRSTLDVPSLIVLPIDYSIDVAISEELGAETVAT